MGQQDYAIPTNLLSKGASLLPTVQLPHHSGTAQYHSNNAKVSKLCLIAYIYHDVTFSQILSFGYNFGYFG